MTRENSGVAPAKFRNTASYKIKWRQDYIELKYLRKKTCIFGLPMDCHNISDKFVTKMKRSLII